MSAATHPACHPMRSPSDTAADSTGRTVTARTRWIRLRILAGEHRRATTISSTAGSVIDPHCGCPGRSATRTGREPTAATTARSARNVVHEAAACQAAPRTIWQAHGDPATPMRSSGSVTGWTQPHSPDASPPSVSNRDIICSPSGTARSSRTRGLNSASHHPAWVHDGRDSTHNCRPHRRSTTDGPRGNTRPAGPVRVTSIMDPSCPAPPTVPPFVVWRRAETGPPRIICRFGPGSSHD